MWAEIFYHNAGNNYTDSLLNLFLIIYWSEFKNYLISKPAPEIDGAGSKDLDAGAGIDRHMGGYSFFMKTSKKTIC
jgi:hypothetical protein